MNSVLVVATHLDDETLGCGGSLLKHKEQGDDVHWLLVTEPKLEHGYSANWLENREEKLKNASHMYGFASIHRLGFAAAWLDRTPKSEIVQAVAAVYAEVRPCTIYLPFANDVHSDHRMAFDAGFSAAKSFRAPYLKRILMMETMSETDFAPSLPSATFAPNVFINVTDYFDRKLEIMSIYSDQLGSHPFPRSIEHLRSLAVHRGAAAGCQFAEAFVLLKEIA